MNKSTLDLTEEQKARRAKRGKQRSFTPTAVAKPEGTLFGEKQLETLATTCHFISKETSSLE